MENTTSTGVKRSARVKLQGSGRSRGEWMSIRARWSMRIAERGKDRGTRWLFAGGLIESVVYQLDL
jgi:hypothetical protein